MERGQIIARVFLILFALPFVLSGLGVSGFGLFQTGTAAMAMLQHGQTEGTVVDKSVESATENGRTVYYPRIEYTYTVNGESYTSERIFPPDERRDDAVPGREYGTRDRAADVVDDYGGRPTVYYPKGDPGKGFLESPTDNPLFGLVMLLFGLPFLGAGGLVMYMGLAGSMGDDEDEGGGGGEGEVPPDIDDRLESGEGLGDDDWGSDFGDDGGGGGFDGGGGGGGDFE